VTFIGPPVAAIHALGSKSTSKVGGSSRNKILTNEQNFEFKNSQYLHIYV
jgi:acetyl/propionyl-CoA carboxylase alpha subunit